MIKFDFMVQTRDRAIVAAARSVAVPDSIAVWPIIVKLAHKIDEPGTNPCGERRGRSYHPRRRRLRPQSCQCRARSWRISS